jgi:signal transduction histidine kinase
VEAAKFLRFQNLLLAAVAVWLLVSIRLFQEHGHFDPRHYVAGVAALLCCGVCALLMRRGRFAPVAHFTCSGLLLIPLAMAALHGVRSPGLLLSSLSIAVSGYLLGLGAAVGYGAAGMTLCWGLFLVQSWQGSPFPEPPVEVLADILLMMLLVTGGILAIPLQGMIRAHGRLFMARRTLDASIRTLEERSRSLEADVETGTRELEVVNTDLKRFPLALAHDLRTPLQTLSGYASLLAENEEDPETVRDLSSLQQAVEAFEEHLVETLESGRRQALG